MRFFLVLFLLLGATIAHADNPFGVMLGSPPGQAVDLTALDLTAARAAALGVAWFRPPSLFVDRWRGNVVCPSCRRLRESGLSLVLTLRNSGRDAAPLRASAPPGDLAVYGSRVAAILAVWMPAMLVVEDEENNPLRFNDGRVQGVWDSGGDTAQGYRQELETACAVAHNRHGQCSNGGLSFEAVTGLTWLTMLQEGRPDQACDYARRTLLQRRLREDERALCDYRTADKLPASLRETLLQNADRLLPVYRASAIDAVNFHWYGADPVSLAQTIDIFGRLVGKPAMCNEMGQRRADADPSHVRPLLRAAMAGGLKVAIWISIDNDDGLSLFDEQGRLRASGEEFAHQMSGRK